MVVDCFCLCCLIAIVVVAITATRSRKSVPSAIGSGSLGVSPQPGIPMTAFFLPPIPEDGALVVPLDMLGDSEEKGV